MEDETNYVYDPLGFLTDILIDPLSHLSFHGKFDKDILDKCVEKMGQQPRRLSCFIGKRAKAKLTKIDKTICYKRSRGEWGRIILAKTHQNPSRDLSWFKRTGRDLEWMRR